MDRCFRCRRSRSSRRRAAFDYTAKYLLKSTQEICPGRFAPDISAQIMDQALRAHRALSCSGYSRTDFIVSAKGPIYLETNTLPGLTKASLYPKALKAQGIEFPDFLQDQILLAAQACPEIGTDPAAVGPLGWSAQSLKS